MIDLAGSVASQRARINHRMMAKCWQDVERYRVLLRRLRPAVVIETGTWEGWSARFFRGYAPLVVTIDIHTPRSWKAEGLYVLAGHSTDEPIARQVREIAEGLGPVMVSLDSDHDGEHVLAEMETYGPLVTQGSYMVVEDGIIHWLDEYADRYPIDPYDATSMFLANHPEYEADREIEDRWPVTQFPNGWLRKVAGG